MRITLHQLKVFDTVATHSGFSRASKALHLTQPTVSMQVKQLADAVGTPLFEQIGKKIFLTEAGTVVQGAARQMFEVIERMEAELADLKGLKQGRLKVSVVTTAKYFVPRLLGPFTREYPGIDISLDVGNRSEIVARLTRNEDDLYIMGVPPAGMDIKSHPFVENPIVAIAPVNHPLVGKKRIALSRLAAEPFLLREPGSGTRMASERFLKSHGIRLNMRMELGSNEAIKQAVAGGLGLSLLSLHSLKAELARGEVAMLDVAELPIKRSWYIVHRNGKRLSVAARAFFSYLKAEGTHLQQELQQAQVAAHSGTPKSARSKRSDSTRH